MNARISAVLIGSALFYGTVLAGGLEFNFVSIDYPGAKYTLAEGIGAGGEVAGMYTDTSGVSHGFVLWHGSFTTIDYPGAM